MNEHVKQLVLVAVIFVALIFVFSMFGSAMAQPPQDVPADVDKGAAVMCSKKSMGQSLAWVQRMAQQESDLRKSIMSTPDQRLQAQANALLANNGAENLVLQCAIWRRLGGGSV